MSKRQLISEIRRLNEHATARFLSQFNAIALREYLTHLKIAQRVRIRMPRRIGGEFRMVS
jgi:hypothetical protein